MSNINTRTENILRRLVHRDNVPQIQKVLAKTRVEDVAAAMQILAPAHQKRLFAAIEDQEYAANVLCQLPQSTIADLLVDMDTEALATLIGHLDADDATDVLTVLPDEVREGVLSRLKVTGDDEEGELTDLLAWPPDSAGGLMSPSVFKMTAGCTCAEAITELQSGAEELTSAHYLYVVNDEDQLLGVISLRYLVVHPPATLLADIMTPHPICVSPEQDQEEVARFVARYDLLSIPVVDDQRHLLGIVTVDDVIDVIRSEAAEDMLKMAGLAEGTDLADRSLVAQVRQRGGWLMATIAGGICAAEIIGLYEETLKTVAVLAGFIPVIMGMGGNVGIQSATIAVRGLAVGHIQLGGAMRFIFREARVGLLLGLAFGLVLLVYGVTRYGQEPMIGVAIGTSIVLAISLASFLGAGIPIVLSKFDIDPAVAAGPLLTTAVDILGIIVYFQVAKLMLGL